jgi:DNA-binding MarR family transcriptional regulator
MDGTQSKKLLFLLMTGQRAVERWIEGQEKDGISLTAAQAGMLFYLSRNEGALIGDVALALQLGASSISGLVDRMERRGLILRQRDTKDGRAIRLYQTEAGREATFHAKEVLTALNDQLNSGFSSQEMDVVYRWMEGLQSKFNVNTNLD